MLKNETKKFQINVLSTLPISDARLADIMEATDYDTALKQLREYALTCWPAEKREVPDEVRPF